MTPPNDFIVYHEIGHFYFEYKQSDLSIIEIMLENSGGRTTRHSLPGIIAGPYCQGLYAPESLGSDLSGAILDGKAFFNFQPCDLVQKYYQAEAFKDDLENIASHNADDIKKAFQLVQDLFCTLKSKKDIPILFNDITIRFKENTDYFFIYTKAHASSALDPD